MNSNSTGWFALLGALGGVLLTGVTSILTAALAHRWSNDVRASAQIEEETRARQEQRREAAHRYLMAANQYYQALDEAHDRIREGESVSSRHLARTAFTAMQDAYVYVTIGNSSEVRRLAHEYNLALYELDKAATQPDDVWNRVDSTVYRSRDLFRAAVRAELGVHN